MDITSNAVAESQTQNQAANPLALLHALFGARAGKAKGCVLSGDASSSCSSFLKLLSEQMQNVGQKLQNLKAEVQSDEYALLPEVLDLLLSGGSLVSVGIDGEGLLTVMKTDADQQEGQTEIPGTDLYGLLTATGLASFLEQAQGHKSVKTPISAEALLSVIQSQIDPEINVKSPAMSVEAGKILEAMIQNPAMPFSADKRSAAGQEKQAHGGSLIPLGADEQDAIKIEAPGSQKTQNGSERSFALPFKEALGSEAQDMRVSQKSSPDSGELKFAMDQGAKDKGVEKWAQAASENRVLKSALAEMPPAKAAAEATPAVRPEPFLVRDQEQKITDRIKNNPNPLKGDQAENSSDLQMKMKLQKNPVHNEQKIAQLAVSEAESGSTKIKAEVRGKAALMDKSPETAGVASNSSASGPTQSKPVSPVTATSIIDRVATEFRETLAQESGRVRMTLTPPSLGTLEMDVLVRNGKVRVMLFAESRDVQKMLAGSIDTLKNSLTGQGMTIERCDVLMQDRRDGYSPYSGNQGLFEDGSGRSGHRQAQEETGRNAAGGKPSVFGPPAPTGRPSSDSDSISLFA
ncbi:MAG TPA: flagellar hook-length control protein FliK [Smithellaceae bacterium]|nr:flagellar hook-length control protein FliK [Smithellaceae bacterium]